MDGDIATVIISSIATVIVALIGAVGALQKMSNGTRTDSLDRYRQDLKDEREERRSCEEHNDKLQAENVAKGKEIARLHASQSSKRLMVRILQTQLEKHRIPPLVVVDMIDDESVTISELTATLYDITGMN